MTIDATTKSANLRAALADELADTGDLRTHAWRKAFLATPRHAFLSSFHQQTLTGVVEVTEESPDWLHTVYSDASLVIQVTDGLPTSSSTMPGLMMRMLEALGVRDGMNVLEVGTGTGYNTALLCARLADHRVTTIDVDPTLTAPARERLAGLGMYPQVVTGDGADGVPDRAPFDRIIATCAVRHLPMPWLRQLTSDGAVMATVETGLHGYGLALVRADGHGRILTEKASFMPMRSHADPAFTVLCAQAVEPGMESRTDFLPSAISSNATRFVLGLSLPGTVSFGMSENGAGGLYLAHRTDGSWARVRDDGHVLQGGPRRLWDELEQAHGSWLAAGSPQPHDLLVTVDDAGQHLHTPAGDFSLDLSSPAAVTKGQAP